MPSDKPCKHELLDEEGRCQECGVYTLSEKTMLNPEDASSEWLKKHLSQHCQLWLFDYTVKSLRLEILKQMIAYANHVTAELSQKNAILSDNITKLQKENAELHANLRRVNAGDRQAMDNRNAGDGQAMDS